MSRMGSKPILIPENTEVKIEKNEFFCKGKEGEFKFKLHPKINAEIKDKNIFISRKGNDKLAKSIHGVTRKILINGLTGVNEKFEKKLDVVGIGYKISLQGKKLVLSLGYSHPINFEAPKGIEFQVIKNSIIVKGVDKQQVGQIASEIRALRKPEPYKGKGIKYSDELIKIKAGKTAKSEGGAK